MFVIDNVRVGNIDIDLQREGSLHNYVNGAIKG